MTKLILSSSFKRAFKVIIKSRPDLKSKIEAKLRLLAEDPYNPIFVRLNMIVVLSFALSKIKKPCKKKSI